MKLMQKHESEVIAGLSGSIVQPDLPVKEPPVKELQDRRAGVNCDAQTTASQVRPSRGSADESRKCPQFVLAAKDAPPLFDPPERAQTSSPSRTPPSRTPPSRTPPLDPEDVGAVVIGACGGTITVNGLAENGSSQSSGKRPSSAPRSSQPERRPTRASSAGRRYSTMNGHHPPWTLEVGSGSRHGGHGGIVPTMQCSAGCLQALVKLRPGTTGASISLGS